MEVSTSVSRVTLKTIKAALESHRKMVLLEIHEKYLKDVISFEAFYNQYK